jgi:hypothetical protein
VQIRLTITSVRFAASLRGGHYHVNATVSAEGTTESLSDPERDFAPVNNQPERTGTAAWTRRLDVNDPTSRIMLEVVVTRATGGEVDRFTHAWPANVYYQHTSLGGGQVTIELSSRLPEGRRRPQHVVYARRHPDGADERPTVAAAPRVAVHVEIDPVVPPPLRPELVRPAFVRAHGTHREPIEEEALTAAVAPSAINPAVIPAWDDDGEPDATWMGRWGAHIHATVWYRGPLSMSELTWTHETIDGQASIAFAGGNDRGRTVTVFGRGQGEVLLHVAYRGRRLGSYRALVRAPARLRARFVVHQPADDAASRQAWQQTEWGQAAEYAPSFSYDAIRGALDIGNDTAHALAGANAYLRQVAIELVEDRPAELRTAPFEDSVMVEDTRVVDVVRPHATDGMITYVLMHSRAAGGGRFNNSGGVTPIVPRSGISNASNQRSGELNGLAADVEIDRGSPSSSWVAPCGAPPNPQAEPTELVFFLEANPVGTGAVVCLFRQTGGFDGQTIAHETGHALNLAHFVADNEALRVANLMASGAGTNDLDIAQAKIIWHSPLLP